jgi:pyruvate formate lyase activating enzyme
VGIVFDIQRGSLRDGPGVRTTVFLKGCPLRCRWCHNPEAMRRMPQLSFNVDRCVICGDCGAVCPEGAHRFEGGGHVIDFSRCVACGRCVDACDHEGLWMVGSDMSADDVMTEVCADQDFYRHTGGGMTLSGGEPLCQPDFALELLRKSRALGIATCVETSGFVPAEVLERALAYVDLLLVDYKMTDPQKHIEYTGVTNERILENLEGAYKCGTAIMLRCPIVPGVNDDDQHLRGIREIDKKYPGLRGIELLAYHNLGVSKARCVSQKQQEIREVAIDPVEKQTWLQRLRTMGCTRAQLG